MLNRKTAVVLMGTALLAGCGTTAPAQPTQTVTQTLETPSPTVTVTETAAASTRFSDAQQRALLSTWNSLPATQQTQICDAWKIPAMQDGMLNSFVRSGQQIFDRDVARKFFNDTCG
ncbi:hypothetical protein [Terrabacter sp. 2YAF2]|uniref:hypothetical protein n=1 Tax=Terrabacter sp. 2YAF2 TaxID=3233026 RepID=UPI003F97B538